MLVFQKKLDIVTTLYDQQTIIKKTFQQPQTNIDRYQLPQKIKDERKKVAKILGIIELTDPYESTNYFDITELFIKNGIPESTDQAQILADYAFDDLDPELVQPIYDLFIDPATDLASKFDRTVANSLLDYRDINLPLFFVPFVFFVFFAR